MPCYLFVIIPAPYFQRFSKNPFVGTFVAGVTAAATGAIAGAAFVLGRRAIFDAWTSVIAVATLIVLLKVKNVPEPLVIVATGFLGFACGAGELFIEFSDRGCTMAELCSRSHVSS